MAIYLNVINLSKELAGSEVDSAINRMAAQLLDLRKTFKNNDSATLDLTLMLTTEDAQPDFCGMRMRSYSSSEDTLYIEAALPLAVLHSPQAYAYVSALVQDAIENASEFFTEHQRHFPAIHWLAALYGQKVA